MLYKLSGAPPAVGAALRFAYAGLFLALLAWRAGALRPGPGFAPAAAAGVIVGIEVVIWNEATGRIGAGPSTVIVNTASLWVMVLTVVVLRRPVGWRPVAGAAVVICGLVLLRGTGEHRLELAGIALAILAAALYGAYILVFARAVESGPRRHRARAVEHGRRGAGRCGVRGRPAASRGTSGSASTRGSRCSASPSRPAAGS